MKKSSRLQTLKKLNYNCTLQIQLYPLKSQNLSLLINNNFTNRLSFLNFTLTNKQHNMKKIYVLSLALSTALAGFSQFTSVKGELVKRKEFKELKAKPSISNHIPKGLTLWSNEFDNSADWVLDNSCVHTLVIT